MSVLPIVRKTISKYRHHPILGSPLKWLGLTKDESTIIIPPFVRGPLPRPFEGRVYTRPMQPAHEPSTPPPRPTRPPVVRKGTSRPLRRANSSLTIIKERIARRERSTPAPEESLVPSTPPRRASGSMNYTDIAHEIEDRIMRSPEKPSRTEEIALREVKVMAHTEFWNEQLAKSRLQTARAIKQAQRLMRQKSEQKAREKLEMEKAERRAAAHRARLQQNAEAREKAQHQADQRFFAPDPGPHPLFGNDYVPFPGTRNSPTKPTPAHVLSWRADQERIRREEEEEKARKEEEARIADEQHREQQRLFNELIAERLRARKEENARLAAQAEAEQLRRKAELYQARLEQENRRRAEAQQAAELERAREREELARLFSEREARVRHAMERQESMFIKQSQAMERERLAHEAQKARDQQELHAAQQSTRAAYEQVRIEHERLEQERQYAAQQQQQFQQAQQQQYQQQYQYEYQQWQQQQQQGPPPRRDPSLYPMDVDDDATWDTPAAPPPPPPPLNRDPSVRTLYNMYEAKWEALRAAKINSVRFTDIPWPILSKNPIQSYDEFTKQNVLDFIMQENRPNLEGKGLKARLKLKMLRWHPDKFNQNFGTKIHNDDLDSIIDGVGMIARILIELNAGKL